MRVTILTALAVILMALPIQAAGDDHTWGGDPDRMQVTAIEYHTWGGDPDTPDQGWVSWWWFVMNVLYFYSCE